MNAALCGCPIVARVSCEECELEDVDRTGCEHERSAAICATCRRASADWTPPAV